MPSPGVSFLNDFSKTPTFEFRNALRHALVCKRKVALRLGELGDGAMSSESFASTDFVPDSQSPYIAGGTLITDAD